MNNHHRKELDLLQKLYGLYDAVMSKIGGYYKTLWTAVDTDIINTELLDFQNRYIEYLCTVDSLILRTIKKYNVIVKKNLALIFLMCVHDACEFPGVESYQKGSKSGKPFST